MESDLNQNMNDSMEKYNYADGNPENPDQPQNESMMSLKEQNVETYEKEDAKATLSPRSDSSTLNKLLIQNEEDKVVSSLPDLTLTEVQFPRRERKENHGEASSRQ